MLFRSCVLQVFGQPVVEIPEPAQGLAVPGSAARSGGDGIAGQQLRAEIELQRGPKAELAVVALQEAALLFFL